MGCPQETSAETAIGHIIVLVVAVVIIFMIPLDVMCVWEPGNLH